MYLKIDRLIAILVELLEEFADIRARDAYAARFERLCELRFGEEAASIAIEALERSEPREDPAKKHANASARVARVVSLDWILYANRNVTQGTHTRVL